MSLALFESFEKSDYIDKVNIPLIMNYISMNLYSWSPNRRYWERQYNIGNKLNIVCRWRKENGVRPIAKKGETICNNKIINFF